MDSNYNTIQVINETGVDLKIPALNMDFIRDLKINMDTYVSDQNLVARLSLPLPLFRTWLSNGEKELTDRINSPQDTALSVAEQAYLIYTKAAAEHENELITQLKLVAEEEGSLSKVLKDILVTNHQHWSDKKEINSAEKPNITINITEPKNSTEEYNNSIDMNKMLNVTPK